MNDSNVPRFSDPFLTSNIREVFDVSVLHGLAGFGCGELNRPFFTSTGPSRNEMVRRSVLI